LSQLDKAIAEMGRSFCKRVSDRDAKELIRICEGIYVDDEP